jgi:hypothetical protein
MISQPSQFSMDDVSAIQALSVNGLTPAAWIDDRVVDLKARAKKHYVAEQDNRCCYCAEQWLTEHGRVWDLEHVVPKAVHPDFMFEPQNLAVACPDCNVAKSNKDTLIDPTVTEYPTSADSFVVVHPHFDRWEDHIAKNGLVFGPITEKGTWTVKHCNLGRFALKYVDPTDDTNPFDKRFESAIADLTADPITAQAALEQIQAYLVARPGAALP